MGFNDYEIQVILAGNFPQPIDPVPKSTTSEIFSGLPNLSRLIISWDERGEAMEWAREGEKVIQATGYVPSSQYADEWKNPIWWS